MIASGSAGASAALSVGFSGMIPTPDERKEQGCSELDILMTVRRLVQRIFELGGRVVYGSHPTFTPIIESIALGMFGTGQRDRVTMLVAGVTFISQRRSSRRKNSQHGITDTPWSR